MREASFPQLARVVERPDFTSAELLHSKTDAHVDAASTRARKQPAKTRAPSFFHAGRSFRLHTTKPDHQLEDLARMGATHWSRFSSVIRLEMLGRGLLGPAWFMTLSRLYDA